MKRLGIWILGYCLAALVVLTANGLVFTQVTSNPEKVKTIFAESGAYDAAAPLVVDELIKQGTLNSGPFSLEKAATRRLAEQVLSGERVQSVFEPVIDSIYAWLQGETNAPKFAVNLSATRDALADDLTKYELERISKLPPCQTVDSAINTNILSLQCKPPVSLDQVSINQAIKDYLQQNGGILNQKLEPSELDLAQGQKIFEQVQNAPQSFQQAKWLPVISGLLALGAAIGVYLLSNSRKQALLYLAISLGVAAVGLLLMPTLNSFLIDQVMGGLTQTNASLAVPLQLLFQTFNDASAYIYYWSAGLCATLGAGLFLVRYFLYRNSSEP